VSERRCKRCEQTLPLIAFNRYKDGHQWWCRECFKAYFRKRGDLHLRQSAASLSARRERAKRYVFDFLRHNPCRDCGETDPVVLEFDHLDWKRRCVSEWAHDGAPIAQIDDEIARCDVVCCNCHRRRTLLRLGFSRTPADVSDVSRPFIRRNLTWIYKYLAASSCLDCGLADTRVLEFDHVGPKRGAVMAVAWNGYGTATLQTEIAQCEIRCANCHRRKTATRAGHYRHRATLQP
jgi:hypothetical protein